MTAAIVPLPPIADTPQESARDAPERGVPQPAVSVETREVQFDPRYHGHVSENGRRDDNDDIRRLFGAIEGFQVKRVRRPRKRAPEWVYNVRKLRMRILGAAARRYVIAYLYWHAGLNAREIAEELKIEQKNVEAVIHKLLKGPEPT